MIYVTVILILLVSVSNITVTICLDFLPLLGLWVNQNLSFSLHYKLLDCYMIAILKIHLPEFKCSFCFKQGGNFRTVFTSTLELFGSQLPDSAQCCTYPG